MRWLMLFMVFTAFLATAQVQNRSLPSETIFIEPNAKLLISAEELRYSLSAFSGGSYSEISKLAMVELVNESGQSVNRSMVMLNSGRGEGAFSIPNDFKTGAYNLIAYTRWMQNFGIDAIASSVLKIINLNEDIDQLDLADPNLDTASTPTTGNAIAIETDRLNYSTRERITLKMSADDLVDVAISVRPSAPDCSFVRIDRNDSLMTSVGSLLVPEIRGDLITGTLSLDGQPKEGVKIFLTSAEKNFDFHASETDSVGRFFFTTQVNSSKIFISHEPLDGEVDIRLENDYIKNHNALAPKPLIITAAEREYITNKVEHVRVHSAYKEIIKGIAPYKKFEPFFGKADKTHLLDDYTRFVVMDEVIREYVGLVFLRRDETGYLFKVRNVDDRYIIFQENPLMLVDGVPFFTTSELMALDPLKIELLDVVARKYYYQSTANHGILSFRSYEGALENIEIPETTKEFTYDGIAQKVGHARPNYEVAGTRNSKVPDYNPQVYWNANTTIDGSSVVQFFTGDLTGQFDIVVSGFNNAGDQFYGKSTIQVSE
ncbi:MAG: hypothetical protein RJQ09_09430 [Cyclobacteriaceae bacterium]